MNKEIITPPLDYIDKDGNFHFKNGMSKKSPTSQKIIDILLKELSYAYGNNCGNNTGEELCENCHRKYQNWKLSRDAAEKIADKILD